MPHLSGATATESDPQTYGRNWRWSPHTVYPQPRTKSAPPFFGAAESDLAHLGATSLPALYIRLMEGFRCKPPARESRCVLKGGTPVNRDNYSPTSLKAGWRPMVKDQSLLRASGAARS